MSADYEVILDPPLRRVSEEDYQCGRAEDRMLRDPRERPTRSLEEYESGGWPMWSRSASDVDDWDDER